MHVRFISEIMHLKSANYLPNPAIWQFLSETKITKDILKGKINLDMLTVTVNYRSTMILGYALKALRW